jgi:hypothetical protein
MAWGPLSSDDVKVERPVASEVRTIDLVFYPQRDRKVDLKVLGLLGKILSRPCCPLEFFRNAVPAKEIVNCRDKGADLRSELKRDAAQKNRKLGDRDLPRLWILTPTLSLALKKKFCMAKKPGWGKGIYFLPDHDWTGLVVIHELPETIATLWIRLLAKGSVQAKAVQELVDLPDAHPYRRETMRHLAALQVNLKIRQNRTKDQQEVMMNLAPAYEKWYAETVAESEKRGEQRGEQRGQQTKAMEIARRMINKNMPLEEIAELTGFSIAQLQTLQAEYL